MKKMFLFGVAAILVLVGFVVIIGIYKFNFTNDDIYIKTGGKIDSKDATYLIDGEPITLKDGSSELEMIPSSSSKKTTHYFGNDVKRDFNNDGKEDVAFLLTQDNGGSGTFYYLAVALGNDNGYQGTNAILLGDRIAPQTTELKEGKIVVNYADRKIDEPMTTSPSVGVSRYFQVKNNQLIEVK
jgi:hypothetical protein